MQGGGDHGPKACQGFVGVDSKNLKWSRLPSTTLPGPGRQAVRVFARGRRSFSSGDSVPEPVPAAPSGFNGGDGGRQQSPHRELLVNIR